MNHAWIIRELTSSEVFSDFCNRKKLFIVTLFRITQGMLHSFGPRTLKRKESNIVGRSHGSITAVCWKDKRVYITPICS
jgi:hypothetical protein